MNELYPQGSPVTEERITSVRAPRVISRRSYNALLAGLIVLSFAVMGVCSHLTTTADFILFVNRNALAYLVGTLVGTFGGIILMNVGRSKESLGLALTGYALFRASPASRSRGSSPRSRASSLRRYSRSSWSRSSSACSASRRASPTSP